MPHEILAIGIFFLTLSLSLSVIEWNHILLSDLESEENRSLAHLHCCLRSRNFPMNLIWLMPTFHEQV